MEVKRRSRRTWKGVVSGAVALALPPGTGLAQDDAVRVLPDIEVIGVTPIQGTGVDADKVPSNVRTLDAEDAARFRPLDLPDLLQESIGSAVVVNVNNSPYQKNISYRGFTASPLLGDAQGLAVYQNGVRINEPFGDIIQWDLVPEVAIDRIDLLNASPVFGLNALGGALALNLKNGFTFAGVEAEAQGGYWNRDSGSVQVGGANDTVGIYVALERLSDEGWRNRSPADLARFYTDVAVLGEKASANLNFLYADNKIHNTDATPVELIEINRRALFTWPDITDNELALATLNASYDVSDTVSVQALGYFRRLIQSTFNGDEVNAANCDSTAAVDGTTVGAVFAADFAAGAGPLAAVGNGAAVAASGGDGFICTEEDEAELILDQSGNAIASFANVYGAQNTSSTMTKGWGFGLQVTIDEPLFGHDNQFVLGASLDHGLTKFHSESGLSTLTLDRAIFPVGFSFLNTAVFEGDTTLGAGGEVGRGDVGPARAKAKNRYYGIYFSDTFDAIEDLAFTVGGRFNLARIEIRDELEVFFERESTLDGSHRFARFNPAVGMTYSFPAWNTTYYIGYSEANRAPSPVELTCADPQAPCRLPNAIIADPPLEQVVSRTIESGFRGVVRGPVNGITVNWNIGVFESRTSDDIIFVSAGPGIGSGFFRNVGETVRKGVEIGLDGQWNRWRWFIDYSFLSSTFETGFTVASENHPFAISDEIFVEAGDDIPGIPDHALKLGLDYEVTDDWAVGGNVVAVSGVYLRGDEANILGKTNGYAVANLHTQYAVNDWIELFAHIENVFDTEYVTFGVLGETGNEVPIHELPGGITNPRFLSPGQPFAAYVGVRLRLN